MSLRSTSVAIWGTGGHALSVLETALALEFEDVVFVSEDIAQTSFEGTPVVSVSSFLQAIERYLTVIAVGDNSSRQHIAQDLMQANPKVRFAKLVHPSAVISSSAGIGDGTVILQGAIVGAKVRIGDHCIINTGASIDHESSMDAYASLAPGVVTGGRVHIGNRSAIGIAAVVRHSVTIGSDVVIGSASYVHRDLPDSIVAYGTPARVIRQRNGEDPYLA